MIHARYLFDGELIREDVRVQVLDGRVAALAEGVAPAAGDLVLTEGVVAPGFVDLQINGYAGVDFAATDRTGLDAARAALARAGTTAMLPTIITAPVDDLLGQIDSLSVGDADGCSRVLGVHVEGPFLSPHRKGAHRERYLVDPTPEAVARLVAHPAVRMVTLAPERPGAHAAISSLVAASCIVAIGHTDATADEVHSAAQAGATMVTHLFNAQRHVTSREPGVPGAALVDERLTLGLIADLHHVATDLVRLAFAAAGARIALVSDALSSAGMPPGEYSLGDDPVVVEHLHGPAHRLDGTLAGSGVTLAAAVRNCVQIGVPLQQALAAATATPAQVLGRTDVGRLARGTWADLVWMDDDLDVEGVWIGGQRISASE
jgi:N-acetylglucosamine-6-phosphate deacetylase